MHDEPRCLRITVEGRLTRAQWQDLEGCRLTAESIRRERPLVLDATRLTEIDEEARQALDRLRASGATFVESPGAGREPGSAWRRLCAALARQGG